MAATPVDVSLVSYTYNDSRLLLGLLDSVAAWNCQPKEIVAGDDGSEPPLAWPPGSPWPERVRLVRLAANRGPTFIKQASLDVAGRKFLLSVDCDIRLDPDWLTVCLPLAANPRTGLVSTPIRYAAGAGPLRRYLEICYSHNEQRTGKVDVMPGGVWLIRRETWLAAGGFAGHDRPAGEDEFLSRRLRALGLELRVTADASAWQVRTISRLTMIRRGWTWQEQTYRQALAQGRPLAEVLGVLLFSAHGGLSRHAAGDVRLVYYELLRFWHALARLAVLSDGPPLARALLTELDHAFPAWPTTRSLLLRDLADLGFRRAPEHAASFEPVLASFFQVFTPETLSALEPVVGDILEEGDAPDFSFYDALPPERA